MRPIHVCLVTSGRPSEIVCGGEEKFTLSLGNWLAQHGNSVTILCRRLFGVAIINPGTITDAKPQTKSMQGGTLRLPYLIYSLALLATSLLFVVKILRINKESRLSILHAQDTGYGGLGGVIAGKLLGLPVIISSHGLRYYTIRNNLKGFSKVSLPLEFCIDSFVSRSADLLILVSPSQKTFFHKIGADKDKLIAIPVGINVGEFNTTEDERSSVRKELGINQDILLGFIGRLSPEKKLLSLFEAFAVALKQSNNIKLLVVGTGPLDDKLKSFCKSEGLLDKTIFTGVRTDISKILSAIDVFILPSYTEGCPTVLLEAMSSGKAIIASNIPSIRDVVKNGTHALLVNPYDNEELKQAILLLSKDAELRSRLKKCAQKKVRHYDANQIYPQIYNSYKLLSKS